MSDSRFQKLLALAIVTALVAAGLFFHARLGPDFWPLDRSTVGPNLIAAVVQGGLVFFIAVLLYPAVSRRFHRFVDRKLGGVHEKLDSLHASHQELHEHIQHLHRRLDANGVARADGEPPPSTVPPGQRSA